MMRSEHRAIIESPVGALLLVALFFIAVYLLPANGSRLNQEARAAEATGYCDDDGSGIVHIEATSTREVVDMARRWRYAYRDRYERMMDMTLDSIDLSNGVRLFSIVIAYYPIADDSPGSAKKEE